MKHVNELCVNASTNDHTNNVINNHLELKVVLSRLEAVSWDKGVPDKQQRAQSQYNQDNVMYNEKKKN